jgi:hypothetical protein
MASLALGSRHTASAAERYKIFMKITTERGLFLLSSYNNFDH